MSFLKLHFHRCNVTVTRCDLRRGTFHYEYRDRFLRSEICGSQTGLMSSAAVQEELGVSNNGLVYAAFRYEAKNSDELSFAVNEALTILKKGDASEEEWFWARNAQGNTGYVPSNFLAVSRRDSVTLKGHPVVGFCHGQQIMNFLALKETKNVLCRLIRQAQQKIQIVHLAILYFNCFSRISFLVVQKFWNGCDRIRSESFCFSSSDNLQN